jgi:8-oxo-dGTP diphosphatase
MIASEVKFCLRCGTALILAQRYGGLRPVCPYCDWIYFPDSKVAVAALVEKDGKILLVRRLNEPRRGFWSLPAGFVDAGEDPARAVERECLEETGLQVCVIGLLDVLAGQEHPRGAHILIAYRVESLGGTLHAGDDVDRAEFFSKNNLPPLAFETTQHILHNL